MTNEQLMYFKNLFEKMLHDFQLKNDLTVDESGLTGDEIDRFLDERETTLNLKLRGREKFFIKKIRYALWQIEHNLFGFCHDCEEEIDFLRLQARPTANYCISCKEEREREEEQIPYHKRSHTHGKTFAASNLLAMPQRNQDDIEEKIEQFNQLRFGE